MSYSEKASGYIKGDGNGNFESRFTAPNGLLKNFNGRFSSAIPQFQATLSEVDFNTVGEFSGTYDIDSNATVGASKVNLPLVNSSGKKLLITGDVNPYLPQAYSATGSGAWSSS